MSQDSGRHGTCCTTKMNSGECVTPIIACLCLCAWVERQTCVFGLYSGSQSNNLQCSSPSAGMGNARVDSGLMEIPPPGSVS